MIPQLRDSDPFRLPVKFPHTASASLGAARRPAKASPPAAALAAPIRVLSHRRCMMTLYPRLTSASAEVLPVQYRGYPMSRAYGSIPQGSARFENIQPGTDTSPVVGE